MYLIDRSNKNISARDVDLIGASSGFGKTKLSAAMLALIAAGASAPVMMSQFQDEKEGQRLTAYRTVSASGQFAAV